MDTEPNLSEMDTDNSPSQVRASKTFDCTECGKTYTLLHNLKRHLISSHPTKANEMELQKSLEHYICEHCKRSFRKMYLLKRHKRNDHRFVSGTKQYGPQCPICHDNFEKRNMLSHFEMHHDLTIEIEQEEFENFQEFLVWKENIEKMLKCSFKKDRATSKINDTKRHYFSCHRSGFYVPRKNSETRHLKTQGSCKINGYCPAGLKVKEADQGKCFVEFVKTHVGHQNDVGHLHILPSDRDAIAAKIAAKVPFGIILDEIRDSISESGLERKHLLSKKDLENIERKYNLQSTAVRHADDGTSVEAWINEMQNTEKSCVLFYKPQGVTLEGQPFLSKEDFVMVIMNEAQAFMLKQFGSDCICLDDTHGLNSYGFKLITLLVLDDMRQGFPGAFLISNRTDHQVIAIFLSYLKSEVGQIKPKVFMSDMADSFYNAWIEEMGEPEKRLFCTWHVDRAWRSNLNKIKGKEKQIYVYKVLRTLLQERNLASFKEMIDNVVTMLISDTDTYDFGCYFQQYYAARIELWAYCHRMHSGLNTNMHIERMHRTIKYIYLNGRNVKRLDKAIHAIMQFVRDKVIDRLMIISKGKITSKVKDIRKRHTTSLENKCEVSETEGGWTVSSSNQTNPYFIQENRDDCKCQLLCVECKSCLHQYSCTCIDSAIKWNMCKHIHALCQFKLEKEKQQNTEKALEEYENNLHIVEQPDESEVLVEMLCEEKSEKQPFQQKLHNFKKHIIGVLDNITSQEELDAVKKHCSSIEAIIQATRNNVGTRFHASTSSSKKTLYINEDYFL